MKTFNKSISKRIDELRKQKNISWEKLAYSAGISKGGLSDIKNGIVEARLSTLCKIMLVLDVSIQEFFNFDLDISEFDV